MRPVRAARPHPSSRAEPGLALVAFVAALAASSGCVGPRGRTWDFDGATMRRIGWAAWDAAASPEVLLPAASAAIFQADDWDNKVSRWAGERTPIFGSQSGAEESSDLLVYGSLAAAGAAVLAVPTGPEGAYTWGTKLADLGGAGAALGATLGVTEVLQHEVGRERPHGGQKTSFPSSHASGAAAANGLTARYVEHLPAPEWAKWTMDGALVAATYATG